MPTVRLWLRLGCSQVSELFPARLRGKAQAVAMGVRCHPVCCALLSLISFVCPCSGKQLLCELY